MTPQAIDSLIEEFQEGQVIYFNKAMMAIPSQFLTIHLMFIHPSQCDNMTVTCHKSDMSWLAIPYLLSTIIEFFVYMRKFAIVFFF